MQIVCSVFSVAIDYRPVNTDQFCQFALIYKTPVSIPYLTINIWYFEFSFEWFISYFVLSLIEKLNKRFGRCSLV